MTDKQIEMANDIKHDELMRTDFDYFVENEPMLYNIAQKIFKLQDHIDDLGYDMDLDEILDLVSEYTKEM